MRLSAYPLYKGCRGSSLAFVGLSARTMHPYGRASYAKARKRNRYDRQCIVREARRREPSRKIILLRNHSANETDLTATCALFCGPHQVPRRAQPGAARQGAEVRKILARSTQRGQKGAGPLLDCVNTPTRTLLSFQPKRGRVLFLIASAHFPFLSQMQGCISPRIYMYCGPP